MNNNNKNELKKKVYFQLNLKCKNSHKKWTTCGCHIRSEAHLGSEVVLLAILIRFYIFLLNNGKQPRNREKKKNKKEKNVPHRT